jgi:hypothetical protein
MRECPVWLDTPQHKCRRQIRRPFAIIAGKYQEVVERHLSYAAEEKEKQVLKGNVQKESKKGKCTSKKYGLKETLLKSK